MARATAFYESLGFVKSKTASQDEVSFFRAGGVVLALWGREAQRDDANAGALWNGKAVTACGEVAWSLHKMSQAKSRSMLLWQRPAASGARILKPASKTFWGGYERLFRRP